MLNSYSTLFLAPSENVDVALLLFGFVGILIGIFGKNFTEADGEGFGYKSDRTVPRWQGRLLFGTVGTLLLLIGLALLFSR